MQGVFCYSVDMQTDARAGIKIGKKQKRGGGILKKQPVQTECVFCGEEDARQILLRSFRFFLQHALTERGAGSKGDGGGKGKAVSENT